MQIDLILNSSLYQAWGLSSDNDITETCLGRYLISCCYVEGLPIPIFVRLTLYINMSWKSELYLPKIQTMIKLDTDGMANPYHFYTNILSFMTS